MLSKLSYLKPRMLTRSFSLWQNVKMGPVDPILGIVENYKKDTFAGKIDLSVGAYRDDNGKPWVLPSVREAETTILNSNYDLEYAPIIGNASFIEQAVKLAYGEKSVPLKEKRIAGVQTLSGTGALRVGLDFCKRFLGDRIVYVPNPSWPNHKNIAQDAHLQWKEYRYWNEKTKGLDFTGLTEDLSKAPEGSIVILHACAHNPTGVDPNESEWNGILDIVKKRNLVAFFDSAYQGYTSGNCDRDAKYLRLFVEHNVPVLLAQSFAKNFGLYGQRVGTLSLICQSAEEKERVISQLKLVIRPQYSSPPIGGSRVVDLILKTPKLKSMWDGVDFEIQDMANRILKMRQSLVNELKKAGSPHNWDHIVNQQGMFAYTGLKKDQVIELADKHHIYLVHSGRISVAGLNTKNVSAVAHAFDAVSRNKSL